MGERVLESGHFECCIVAPPIAIDITATTSALGHTASQIEYDGH